VATATFLSVAGGKSEPAPPPTPVAREMPSPPPRPAPGDAATLSPSPLLGGRGEGRGEVSVIPAKHQKPHDPLPVRLLRAWRIMKEAHHLMHLLAQGQLRIGSQPLVRAPSRLLRARRQFGKRIFGNHSWTKGCRCFIFWPQEYGDSIPTKLSLT
jgi:hypothetical protein